MNRSKVFRPVLSALIFLVLSRFTTITYASDPGTTGANFEEHSVWVKMPVSRIDRDNNVVVMGEVPNFSVFSLMGTALYELKDAHAYPVPWKPNDGKDETGTEKEGITFTNLAAECVIKIYTISGELVVQHDYKGGGDWTWDVKTSHREEVFSGVYIYCIESEKERKTGKLVIIR